MRKNTIFIAILMSGLLLSAFGMESNATTTPTPGNNKADYIVSSNGTMAPFTNGKRIYHVVLPVDKPSTKITVKSVDKRAIIGYLIDSDEDRGTEAAIDTDIEADPGYITSTAILSEKVNLEKGDSVNLSIRITARNGKDRDFKLKISRRDERPEKLVLPDIKNFFIGQPPYSGSPGRYVDKCEVIANVAMARYSGL